MPTNNYTNGAYAKEIILLDGDGDAINEIHPLDVHESGIVSITNVDDIYHDAFQRLRVSDTDQRFDAEFLYDKQPLLFDEILGGAGTATQNATSRDVTLAIGSTALASAAGLYQHWYNPYTAGNSQLPIITGTINGANLAGTAAVFLRSTVTGSTTEEVIPQAQWLSQTSGINWQYSQIFAMDFQSLKVGRIRFAIDSGGMLMPVATITNDNKRATGYWQLAHAPMYWRIYNTASATITEFGYGDALNAIGFRFTSVLTATQTCRAICATVKSEGGGNLFDMTGFPFSASNGATLRTVSTTLIPVLSIQIQPTFKGIVNREIVIPAALGWVNDIPIYYQVILNPTLTGASFASVSSNSAVFADVSATALTGGTVISSGYAGAGGTRAGAQKEGLTGRVPLSINYAGTIGDILTIAAVRTGTSNASAGVSLDWKEIR